MAIKREKALTIPVIDAVNAELQTNQQRAELEKVRMLWFRVAVIVALLAIRLVCAYIRLTQSLTVVPALEYYWHMPLMFLLACTTLVIITLRSVASFGQSNEVKDNNHPAESLLDKVTELCNKVVELISKSESK
ncbi:hypothetical protein EJK55_1132 [Moraxella catarrhalis]|uniref:DUF202 domain-containing protein n=1 Tax=Moraxella catarrhalis TaxID=480 RepID=A0ABY0BM79_MORCA|nr:hypothetical protein [Moraxella catarrhalis]RUO17052.1 hypothetical protein EJK55_1132 [Moraxella catarrhalis]RUO17573.1 hypothetical protein EJK54_1088 [Moraxella catarrhalis]